MTFDGPIGGLIDFAIGGGWGSEVPKEKHSRVAVIRGTDIPKVAAGDFSTVPFRYESDKKILNRILAPGDIVLETAGGSSANGQYTGRTLLITQEILDVLGPTICASFCKKLVLNKVLVTPPYFYFYMQDLYKSGRVASYDSQSTGISNFQYEAFVNNEVLELPKLELQTSVAAALSSLQFKINTNSQISKTLEDIAQTIFKSWFIDFDPVKAKMAGEKPAGMDAATAALFPDSMEESELGLIPKGWEATSLGVACNIKQGKYLAPNQMSKIPDGDENVPVIGGNGVLGYTSKSTFSFDIPLVTCRGSRCGLLQWANYPAWVSNNAMAISMKASSDYSQFLYLYFKQVNFENVITGSAQPQITITNLSFMKILVPDEKILRNFTMITEQMRKLMISLNTQNGSLSKLLDSLLPRLISGELEIPEEMLAS